MSIQKNNQTHTLSAENDALHSGIIEVSRVQPKAGHLSHGRASANTKVSACMSADEEYVHNNPVLNSPLQDRKLGVEVRDSNTGALKEGENVFSVYGKFRPQDTYSGSLIGPSGYEWSTPDIQRQNANTLRVAATLSKTGGLIKRGTGDLNITIQFSGSGGVIGELKMSLDGFEYP